MSSPGDVDIVKTDTEIVVKLEVQKDSFLHPDASTATTAVDLVSKVFESNCGKNVYRWQLTLSTIYVYPRSIDHNYFGLSLKSLEAVAIEAECKCVILDNRSIIAHDSGIYRKIGTNTLSIPQTLLMDNTKCTIFCLIKYTSVNSDVQIPNLWPNSLNNYAYERGVSDDLEKLFQSAKFSDVKFIINGKQTVQAHKAVLSNRSPVFATMFEHDMKENAENKVEINDIDYRVFKEMVRFIYSGKVQEIDIIAADLLAAADKYALENLKTMCGECLGKHLSIDNALEYLSIADHFSVDNLKKQVMGFIAANAKKMVVKPEFRAIGSLRTDLILEVFQAVASQINKF